MADEVVARSVIAIVGDSTAYEATLANTKTQTDKTSQAIADKFSREQIRAAKEAERALAAFEKKAEKAAQQIAKAQAAAAKEAAKAEAAREKASKAADKAARDMVKWQEKANAAALKSAQQSSTSWNQVAKNMQSNQMISDLEQLGGMFVLVGGNVSKMAMIFTSAVRPVAMLGAIMGPNAPIVAGFVAMGAALLGIPMAAKAASTALLEFGRDAVKVRDDVRGLVPKDVINDLDRLKASFDGADKVAKVQAATLASELSPEIKRLNEFGVAVSSSNADLATSFYKIGNAGMWVFGKINPLTGVLKKGFEEWFDVVADGGGKIIEKVNGNLANVINEIQDNEKANKNTEKSWDELGYAADKAADRMYESMMQQKQLDALMTATINESVSDLLTEEGKLLAARDERIHQLEELGATEEDIAMATIAMNSRIERELSATQAESWRDYDKYTKKKIDLLDDFEDAVEDLEQEVERANEHMQKVSSEMWAAYVEEGEDAFEQVAAFAGSFLDYFTGINELFIEDLQGIVEERQAAAQEEYDAWHEGQQEANETWYDDEQNRIDKMLARGQITDEQADHEQRLLEKEAEARDAALEAEYESKIESLDKIGQAQQEAALQAFENNKKFQIAQASIDAIGNILKYTGFYAPFLGPGAIIAAGIQSGLDFALAVSQISAQSPPEFPTGLSSDHYMAGLQRGEMVASKRAAADPVVRDAIDAGNEGRRVSPSSGTTVVTVGVDRRTGRLRVRKETLGKRPRRRGR